MPINRHIVIPIFVPHKGCPFDCIYCNQKAISGQLVEMTPELMENTIETYLKSIFPDSYIEVAFYGGSFTGIEKSEQISLLKIAKKYLDNGSIKGIRLSTRPDYITNEIMEYLVEYGVNTIELGVQSLDDGVLKKSCRGHNAQQVEFASKLIKKYNVNLGIQTMIGLPQDTAEKDIITATKVVGLKPQIVRIYPTLVIKDTFLEMMYKKGEYKPLTLEEAVDISAKLLQIYRSNNIKVIRVGLQPTEDLNDGKNVIAGPFHPAFRQLAEAKLMLYKIEDIIEREGLANSREIVIYANSGNISNVVGQKRENIVKIKEKYNIKNVIIRTDNTISEEQGCFICI